MRKKIIFLFIFLLSNFAFSSEKKTEMSFDTLPYKKSINDCLLGGEVFSESKVQTQEENNKKLQSLKFSIAGLHKKNCSYALKTLSNYESYNKFLDFVKVSKYNEGTKEIDFILSHLMLPYDMELIFKLPRVDKPGVYPFQFDIGFLKGLEGTIYVSEYKSRCLFYTEAHWQGMHSGINNYFFEVFSKGLSKLSMEVLFRISSTLGH
jgi:hypothetical protein